MAQDPASDPTLAAGTVLPASPYASGAFGNLSGSMGAYGGAPTSSYASQVEATASAYTSGGLNAFQSALPVAAFASTAVPVLGRGGGFDPFARAFSGWGAGKALGISGAKAALGAAAGPGILYGGAILATRFGVEHAIEGQRDFLATRHLMRSVPGAGFGAQSVLGSMSPMATSALQVSSMQAGLSEIGNQYGMTSGQARNVFGNLASAGMVDTSSVNAARDSFRSAMRELKSIADKIGADIDEAVQVYQFLQSSGLQGSVAKARAVANLSATSSMLGLSIPQVMEQANAGVGMARSMGLSGASGLGLALSSMNIAGTMQAASALPQDYLARVGGYAGFGARLMELRLGALQSDAGFGHLGQMFSPSGAGSYGAAFAGAKPSGGSSFARRMDPYMLAQMQEEFLENQAGVVLGRVRSIRSEAGSTLEANRQQYRYLSSLGITDPQEQLAFLGSLRNESRAQMLAGGQAARDGTLAARDSTERELQSAAQTFRTALRSAVDSVAQEFENAGAALQVRTERWTSAMSYGIYGRRREYSAGAYDLASMEEASARIMSGDWSGTSSTPLLEFQRMLERDPMRRMYLGSSANATGAVPEFVDGSLGGVSRAIRFATVTGPRRLDHAVDQSMNWAVSRAFGYTPSAWDPYRAYSGALGGSYSSLTSGESGPGLISMGDGRFATPAQYIQMVARDHGTEYDPRTGRLARFSEGEYGAFAQQYGGQISAILGRAEGGLSASQHAQAQDVAGGAGRVVGALGGGLTAAWTVGKMTGGNLYAAGFAGLTATGLGLYYGDRGGRGLVRGLRNFVTETGMEPALNMTPQMAEMLRAGRAGDTLRNQIALGTFGSAYSDLSGTRRMLLHEFLRREGGEVGNALAPSDGVNLSDDQFAAILYSTMATDTTTMALGVGDTYENRISAMQLGRSGTASLSEGRLQELMGSRASFWGERSRNAEDGLSGAYGLEAFRARHGDLMRVIEEQWSQSLDGALPGTPDRAWQHEAGVPLSPEDQARLAPYVPGGGAPDRRLPTDLAGLRRAITQHFGTLPERLRLDLEEAFAVEAAAGNVRNFLSRDVRYDHGNYFALGGLPEFQGLTDADVDGGAGAALPAYGRYALTRNEDGSQLSLEQTISAMEGDRSRLGSTNAERRMMVALAAARQISEDPSVSLDRDTPVPAALVSETVRQQAIAQGLSPQRAARMASDVSTAYAARPMSPLSLVELAGQGEDVISAGLAERGLGAISSISEDMARTQTASLSAARTEQVRGTLLLAREQAVSGGEGDRFISMLFDSANPELGGLASRLLAADAQAGRARDPFDVFSDSPEMQSMLRAEVSRLEELGRGGDPDAANRARDLRRYSALSTAPSAQAASRMGVEFFFSGEGGTYNPDAVGTITSLGFSSGVVGGLSSIFSESSSLREARAALNEFYGGDSGDRSLYELLNRSNLFSQDFSYEEYQRNREFYQDQYLEEIRGMSGTGATSAREFVDMALFAGGLSPTEGTDRARREELQEAANQAMVDMRNAALDEGGTGLAVREASPSSSAPADLPSRPGNSGPVEAP